MSDKDDSKPTHLRLVTPDEGADEEKQHPYNSGRAPLSKKLRLLRAVDEGSFVALIIAMMVFLYFTIKLILVTPIN